MKCAQCQSVLSGEPTCPTCGTLYTVSRAGVSIPAVVEELEGRLARALEGRYELRGLLGHGGMGAVFLAAELSLDRLVAIKVLPPSLSMDEELLGRFQREAKTAARLDHRSIVPIYAVEAIDGLHFYVMKFVPGSDLADEIPEEGMGAERARGLLWESAIALGHAHRRGVIHRDVKPANIMIDQQGRALLTDFGIAKAVRSGTAMTSTGQMIGTPQYMSPEQMEGQEVDGRADQYSLGMVAWHALAGRQPFGHGSVAALLVKQLNEYPESLAALRPEVPDEMVGAIERAIRKDRDERFDSMEDFARAFWPEQAGAVEGGHRPPSAVSGRSKKRAGPPAPVRWAVAAGLVALFAVTGAIGYSAFSRDDSDLPTGLDAEGATDLVTNTVEAALQSAGADQGDAESASGDVESGDEETTPAPPPTGSEGAATPPTTPSPLAAQPGPAEPVEELGDVTIHSIPPGMLRIDGVDVPDALPYVRQMAPGEYVIEIRREGCQTETDTIRVEARNPTRQRYQLICG